MSGPEDLTGRLTAAITRIVSQTNGITLEDTLDLMLQSDLSTEDPPVHAAIGEFRDDLFAFQMDRRRGMAIRQLLDHPFSQALSRFFSRFPIPYREEHSHLTGALDPSFIFPRLISALEGPGSDAVKTQIDRVYGSGSAAGIRNLRDVENMVRLKDDEHFERYLKILLLPKLILTSRQAHEEAAYHLAKDLATKFNIGYIRLKFTLSRATSDHSEQIPGSGTLSSEDIALGLYQGFKRFQDERQSQGQSFSFILSPCFRKESEFYDHSSFPDKRSHTQSQVDEILELRKNHPCLIPHLREVDTVGDERAFYRKRHFNEMYAAFRKLQYYGFQIRSHHGETWNCLRHGIQAVDNAMNIWNINALEHGVSLGINPNYYFHSLLQRMLKRNEQGRGARPGSLEYNELRDMIWNGKEEVAEKLIRGEPLNANDRRNFTKAKFHTATEREHYQHDVLNRMIHKGVSLMSLPSSNYKLTNYFQDYKDHPFSWWEKKGLKLGVGTDNYITLDTNFLQEMLILLYTDPTGLKITKLLMVTTGETRRPYISHLLWEMNRDL